MAAHEALGYESFGDYMEAEFGFSRVHGYRQVKAATMMETERPHVLTGHEEFILGDAVDGLRNASKCDKSSLLIAIRRNPYEIRMAAVAQRANFRRMPVGVAFVNRGPQQLR